MERLKEIVEQLDSALEAFAEAKTDYIALANTSAVPDGIATVPTTRPDSCPPTSNAECFRRTASGTSSRNTARWKKV